MFLTKVKLSMVLPLEFEKHPIHILTVVRIFLLGEGIFEVKLDMVVPC
jgi:hypothetical protein